MSAWVILEKTFPQSMATDKYWMSYDRGECLLIENSVYETDGILRRELSLPQPSDSFVARQFVAPDSGGVGANQAKSVYFFNRLWRVNLELGYRLEYTALGPDPTLPFTVDSYRDFREDGDGPIRMIVPNGDDSIAILKGSAGYQLSNANGDSAGFRMSRAFNGIGCCNPGSWYSNAEIGGMVVTMWDGGGKHGPRSYGWEPSVGVTEFSRFVRTYTQGQATDVRARINWSQNLILVGTVVHDLVNKRNYVFSSTPKLTFRSRPYFHPQYFPVKWEALELIHDGRKGTCEIQFQSGQSDDGLGKTITHSVKIDDSNKKKFRYQWQFDSAVVTRVGRVNIVNLDGMGITQLGAKTETSERTTDYSGDE